MSSGSKSKGGKIRMQATERLVLSFSVHRSPWDMCFAGTMMMHTMTMHTMMVHGGSPCGCAMTYDETCTYPEKQFLI